MADKQTNMSEVDKNKNKAKHASRNMYPWEEILKKPTAGKPSSGSEFDNDGIRAFMTRRGNRLERQYRGRKTWYNCWSWSDSIAKTCFRLMVVMCLIASAILSTLAGATSSATLSYIAGGLAAFCALHETLQKLLIEDLTTSKRDQYEEKCRIRRQGLDDLFVICAEAISNGKLSVDDLKKYVNAMKDTDTSLGKVSSEESKQAMEMAREEILKNIKEIENIKEKDDSKKTTETITEPEKATHQVEGVDRELKTGSGDATVELANTPGHGPSHRKDGGRDTTVVEIELGDTTEQTPSHRKDGGRDTTAEVMVTRKTVVADILPGRLPAKPTKITNAN